MKTRTPYLLCLLAFAGCDDGAEPSIVAAPTSSDAAMASDASTSMVDMATDVSRVDAAAERTPDASAEDAGLPVSAPAAEYCERAGEMFCRFYLRCDRMAVEDNAGCLEAFASACNENYEPYYIALEQIGTVALSPAGLRTCAEHLDTVECEAQVFDLDGPCRAIWAGQVDEGGDCAPGIGSFVCSAGTTCVVTTDFCGVCEPTVATGAACGLDIGRCVPTDDCVDSVCVTRPLSGAACDPEGPLCALGSSCTDGACTSWNRMPVGAFCDRANRCPYKSVCLGGRCVEGGLLGADCGAESPCSSGICVDGVCTARRAAGAVCTGPEQCLNGCTDGVCAAPVSACFGR